MTLDDLATHHRKQAENFAPFGAANALTVFHSEAAEICTLAMFQSTRVAMKRIDCPKGTTMVTHYKLRTLRDAFDQVPAAKLATCMREIAESMEQARSVAELIDATAQGLGGSASSFWPEECEWVDDGKEDKTITIVNHKTNEIQFTFKSSKAPNMGVEPQTTAEKL